MTPQREDIHVTFTAQDTLAGLFRSPSWNAERDKAWFLSAPSNGSPETALSVPILASNKAQDIDIIRLVAIDLLASCKTIDTFFGNLSMQDALYGNREDNSITALEMHRRTMCSPAAGHHAREPSALPRWPGLHGGDDVEERWATLRAKRRQLNGIQRRSSEQGEYW
ncbi:hypothetical protein EV356DRAFT_339748 [Viridothelium virens]|uniref:Uncharacterized protein n=1 Tax=Viridothelium virens TaxID=1048519 RepID=A0A6A6GXR1_VIRVR|nr:hypothetical protein EV356DRAFT_339748 [Viridothelium virens]